MGIHSCCIHNEVRSAQTRVLAVKHQPLPPAVSLLMQDAGEEIREAIGTCEVIPWETLLSYLPAHKRKLYERCKEELLQGGPQPWHARIKAFVKLERLNFDNDKDPDPRMIQARSPQFNCQIARYTRSVEKALYQLEEEGVRLLAKGRNSRQRAWDVRKIWGQMEDPVVLSLDLSRWDMHCSPDLLRHAHRVYLNLLGNPREFKHLLEQTIHNKCETKNGLKYQREGNVMSGDMTTALGNCMLVCMMVKAFRKSLNLTTKELRVYDDGDDHLLFVERKESKRVVEELPRFYRSLGHSLRVDGQTDQFHQIEFCQQRIICHSDGIWEFVPNPRKTLATSLSWSSGHEDQRRRYLGTVWEMRAILHQGQPVLGPLFHRLSLEVPERLGKRQATPTGLARRLALDRRTKVTITEVTPEAREAYRDAWGLDTAMQLELENMVIDLDQAPREEPDYCVQHAEAG